MEFVIGILGAGIGSGIMSIIQAKMQRKWNKEDKKDEKLDAVIAGLKVIMIDRITWSVYNHIKNQHINLHDKTTLVEMHKTYTALGGNGELDLVMDELNKLPVVN